MIETVRAVSVLAAGGTLVLAFAFLAQVMMPGGGGSGLPPERIIAGRPAPSPALDPVPSPDVQAPGRPRAVRTRSAPPLRPRPSSAPNDQPPAGEPGEPGVTRTAATGVRAHQSTILAPVGLLDELVGPLLGSVNGLLD